MNKAVKRGVVGLGAQARRLRSQHPPPADFWGTPRRIRYDPCM